jgi:chromosome transmission fidelity protein 1
LRDIVQRARAVILAGGTMEPSAPLIDALTRVCQLPSNRIHRFSCGHIIDDHQLLAVCLSTASNGRRLLFDFASRTSPDTMAALAMSILNVLRLVPHGVVVFFPSYDYVDQFVQHLKSTGTIDRIQVIMQIQCTVIYSILFQAVKSLFCESRKDATVWSKYCHQAKSTNGAVLFAVVGGKLSEGQISVIDMYVCVSVCRNQFFGRTRPLRNHGRSTISEQEFDRITGKNEGNQKRTL